MDMNRSIRYLVAEVDGKVIMVERFEDNEGEFFINENREEIPNDKVKKLFNGMAFKCSDAKENAAWLRIMRAGSENI